MNRIFEKLCSYGCLCEEEAYEALHTMMADTVNESRAAAFLTAYMMRKPSVAELGGFRRALMEQCLQVSLPAAETAIDIVGTGGDGKNSFNISTLAAIVTAAAGFKVIKHGNYGASSMSGSSNVLEHLGYCFTNDRPVLERQLDEANICFLHAPLFHPAMKKLAPVRKNLGVRTFFNLLGPLMNPAGPGVQLLGVNSLETSRLYHYFLQDTSRRYAIVHSLDGYDEISLTDRFKVITRAAENIYQPGHFGFSTVTPAAIDGGGSLEAAGAIFMNILRGEGTAEQTNVVAVNSGFAIHLAAPGISLEDGIELAHEVLRSQKAFQTFHQLTAIRYEYS